MPHPALSTAVNRLGRAARAGDAADETTDGCLLSRFVQSRDEPAFGELVRRLGPMVLSVCRRVSGDTHVAEDAFQAAFLVLARRAADVRPPGAVRGWLYGVAVHTAREARAVSARLRARERALPVLPDRAADSHEPPDADVINILDEEIAALPDPLRSAVVLCEIEGRSRRDAAAELDVPEGTLSSRLAKARRLLAARLRGRGVALSSAALATITRGQAAVPSPLAEATAALATSTTPVSPSVAALSNGVIRMMFVQKLKMIPFAVVLLAASVFAGGWLLAAGLPAEESPPAKPAFGFVEVPKAAPAAEKPKGSNKLFFYRSGHLVLVDPDGSNEKKVTEDRKSLPSDCRLSPDGKHYACLIWNIGPVPRPENAGNRATRNLYVRGFDEKEPGTDLGVACQIFAWSPDGTEIAYSDFVDGPGQVAASHGIVNVKTREKTALAIPEDHIITDWSRDGKYFLTTRPNLFDKNPRARIFLMNRDGREHKALTPDDGRAVFGKLSPAGDRMLYISMTPKEETPAEKRARQDLGAAPPQPTRQLMVLDIATGKSAPVQDLPINPDLQGFCWSPDGKKIAYVWREMHEGKPEDLIGKETETFLVVCDPDGKNQKTITTEKGSGQGLITIGQVDWGFVVDNGKEKGKKDEELILGKWKVVSVMDGGKDRDTEGADMIFAKGKVTLATEGKDVQGKYRLDPSKKPKWIDLTLDRQEMLGIYEIDGDKLKICLNEGGGDERSTAFESKAGSSPNDLLLILEREKK